MLKLFAVAVQDHPEQIGLFEMYADATAYKSHLQSPHFLKYKAATQGMVKALKLLQPDALLLAEKGE